MRLSLVFFAIPLIVVALFWYLTVFDAPSPTTTPQLVASTAQSLVTVFGLWAAIYSWQLRVNAGFYFQVARLKAWLGRSPAPVWQLVVEFSCPARSSLLDDVEHRLIEHRAYAGAIRITHRASQHSEFEIRDLFSGSIAVSKAGRDTQACNLTLTNIRVRPDESESVIRHEIMPLVNVIGEAIGPITDERFSLNVSYTRTDNPFMGFYLSQLPPSANVQSFHVTLVFPEEGQATISRESLHLTAPTRTGFQSLSSDLLSLGPNLDRSPRHAAS